MAYTAPSITTSGTTWSQLKTQGASGTLKALIAAQAATAAPTAAPTVATGSTSGGSMVAGTYYCRSTESNGIGETPPGPESAQFTVSQQAAPTGTPTVVVSGSGGSLTNGVYFGKITYVDAVSGETTAGTEFTFTQTTAAVPVITFNDGGLPAFASGRNVYLTAPGGASGTETLAFTGATTGTLTITVNPAASALVPPLSNTTTTNQPVVTLPTLQTGNKSRAVYVTPVNGATGSEVLYASGITTDTYTLTAYSHSGTAAPTVAPTVATGTTTGGLLAPGVYLVRETETNGSGGETTAGPESAAFTVTAQAAPTGTPTVALGGSSSLPAATYFGQFTYVDTATNGETLPGAIFGFTQGTADNGVTITIGDGGLPGWASGRNLYLGTSPLALTQYATGITGTTYALSAVLSPAAAPPPTINRSSTNQPIVTLPSLQAGNNGRGLYLTPPGGAVGSESYYGAPTRATYTLSAAAPAATVPPPLSNTTVSTYAVGPPTVNTTGLTMTNAAGVVGNQRLQGIMSLSNGRFDAQVWKPLADTLAQFLSGEPIPYPAIESKLRESHTAIAAADELLTEIGTLIDANPGHFTTIPTGIGGRRTVRAWSSTGE